MIALAPRDDLPRWGAAGGVALAAHLAVGALVIGWAHAPRPIVPDQVVLIELPPEGGATAAQPAPQTEAQLPARPEVQPDTPSLSHVDVPQIKAPLPSSPVVLPQAQAQPSAPRAVPVRAAPSPSPPLAQLLAPGAGSGSNAAPGTDPKARAQEADYFALVSAHLNRKKRYPVDAKKARQEGVVTVRFTVDRNGNVSSISIKRSSGHDLLDQATLDLLQRVAPLPRMPDSMRRDSVTLSLPIDYSLKTS